MKTETTKDNLALWHRVEKTNPKYTKAAKVGGNAITSISPQFQIMNVTEQFGSYGSTWGFKDIQLDYSLVNTPFMREKTEGVWPNKKVVGTEEAVMGLVVFKAIFFYPDGEFPIINSISLFTNNEMTKIDDNFAKKIETDALTKAISKLGFNADIFMGKFDDVRYVEEMKKEFDDTPKTPPIDYKKTLEDCTSLEQLKVAFTALPKEQKELLLSTKDEMKELLEQVELIGTIKTLLALDAYEKEVKEPWKSNAKIKALLDKRRIELTA